jgi:hypothetical protein
VAMTRILAVIATIVWVFIAALAVHPAPAPALDFLGGAQTLCTYCYADTPTTVYSWEIESYHVADRLARVTFVNGPQGEDGGPYTTLFLGYFLTTTDRCKNLAAATWYNWCQWYS